MWISQALGIKFFGPNHDKDSDPNVGTRLQHDMITDIMPQLFIMDGKFALETKCFQNIEIVNNYCSEQCLGDEVLKYVKTPAEFHKRIGKLGIKGFDYNDGVIINYK
jgi:hypothetical protein